MNLYRFSPVKDEAGLREALKHIHTESHRLLQASFGEYLSVAGNIGFFCHYDDEYEVLTQLRKALTEESDNLNQKYYRLHEPFAVPAEGGIPEATYTHLYIRKPDIYRAQVGDLDFVMDEARYTKEKARLEAGEVIPGARIFPRADLDMIELYNPDVDVLAYASTHSMTEKVRVKIV